MQAAPPSWDFSKLAPYSRLEVGSIPGENGVDKAGSKVMRSALPQILEQVANIGASRTKNPTENHDSLQDRRSRKELCHEEMDLLHGGKYR